MFWPVASQYPMSPLGPLERNTWRPSDRAVLEFSSLRLQNSALPSELGGNGCRALSLPQNDPGRPPLYSIFLLQGSPRSMTQTKSKPKMITPDSRPGSRSRVKSKQNKAPSPRARPYAPRAQGSGRHWLRCTLGIPSRSAPREASLEPRTPGRERRCLSEA